MKNLSRAVHVTLTHYIFHKSCSCKFICHIQIEMWFMKALVIIYRVGMMKKNVYICFRTIVKKKGKYTCNIFKGKIICLDDWILIYSLLIFYQAVLNMLKVLTNYILIWYIVLYNCNFNLHASQVI